MWRKEGRKKKEKNINYYSRKLIHKCRMVEWENTWQPSSQILGSSRNAEDVRWKFEWGTEYYTVPISLQTINYKEMYSKFTVEKFDDHISSEIKVNVTNNRTNQHFRPPDMITEDTISLLYYCSCQKYTTCRNIR